MYCAFVHTHTCTLLMHSCALFTLLCTHMHSLNAVLCTLFTFVHTHVHSLNALVCTVCTQVLHFCTHTCILFECTLLMHCLYSRTALLDTNTQTCILLMHSCALFNSTNTLCDSLGICTQALNFVNTYTCTFLIHFCTLL